MILTFRWSRGKVSEKAHCHFQNISFLQFGVACVVFANKRQNDALQMTEAVIDASTSPLLQQGFQSLEEIRKNRYSVALPKAVKTIKCFQLYAQRFLLFPYLSQFVGLFSLGHG